ncbi:hypothetical protein GobsT_13370 [Gemmata obscuriglobus]|uniref:hypothetical protein n=1 Tax=Gemmata obscuriglobus TaxID=114 RepID=UPI0011CD2BDE|nr:hypothetical protein [Gemmata obscuriglobus]QEG26594.1 hypothetical protein GobsT_13370 [Gemmata obscuriglobus]VTS02071.1 unnamed protein product [Gemmata obscuriglobus UQM 2246]
MAILLSVVTAVSITIGLSPGATLESRRLSLGLLAEMKINLDEYVYDILKAANREDELYFDILHVTRYCVSPSAVYRAAAVSPIGNINPRFVVQYRDLLGLDGPPPSLFYNLFLYRVIIFDPDDYSFMAVNAIVRNWGLRVTACDKAFLAACSLFFRSDVKSFALGGLAHCADDSAFCAILISRLPLSSISPLSHLCILDSIDDLGIHAPWCVRRMDFSHFFNSDSEAVVLQALKAANKYSKTSISSALKVLSLCLHENGDIRLNAMAWLLALIKKCGTPVDVRRP